MGNRSVLDRCDITTLGTATGWSRFTGEKFQTYQQQTARQHSRVVAPAKKRDQNPVFRNLTRPARCDPLVLQ
jgi:hypothetical protein